MNIYPHEPNNLSRRTFTKSVAATLATVPFTLGEAKGGERASQDTCEERHPNVCPQLGDISVPHEPPIVISGGSFSMECDAEMLREASINNPPRRHLYEFDAYLYGTMIRLEVITEYEKLFTHVCYPLAEIPAPRLKIWLQRLRGGTWVEDDIDPRKTDAHILIRYATVDRFSSSHYAAVVEADKEFGDPQQGYKLEPTFKHYHAGYGGCTHFRIGRWKLMRGNGSVVHEAAVGRIPLPSDPRRTVNLVGFQLIPRFNHLARLLQCLSKKRS